MSIRSEARDNFKVSPQAALQPYLRLQNLAFALKEAQPAAEDAAPHLIDHVENSVSTLWKQMKDAFAQDFEQTLSQMKWPNKEVAIAAEVEQEWIDGVVKLLELQEPYVIRLIFWESDGCSLVLKPSNVSLCSNVALNFAIQRAERSGQRYSSRVVTRRALGTSPTGSHDQAIGITLSVQF